MLWCDLCRFRARERAALYGWLGGVAFGLSCAAYVWIAIGPTDLIVGAWAATLATAVWIGQKVTREFIYGAMRFKNSRAAEAVPPSS